MKRWWYAYALLGIATVALLALSPAKSFFSEWRHYQKEYNRRIAELAVRVDPVDPGIKQIWIEEADRIDRCITCHVGFDNPDTEDLPQPFTSHPEVAHDPREYGCTVCHQGQGLATEYVSSIGLVEHWDRPIFPKQYVEAGCGRCHKQEIVPDAPILNRGRKLIEEFNCAACHEIPYAGKSYVVPLDGVGVRMERAQLYRWLLNPRAVTASTEMPDFRFSPEQAIDLTDYLLTFTKLADRSQLPSPPAELAEAVDDYDRVEAGGVTFRKARCISCHQVEGRGGVIGEEIGTAGSHYSMGWLYQYLENPKRLLPGVPMPRYGLSDRRLIDLTAYIVAEQRDWSFNPDELDVPEQRDGFYERGEALWTTYNCAGCHSLSGAPEEGEKGPSLNGIGVKPGYRLETGKRVDLPRDLPDILRAKIAEPRSFFENLRMPQYAFDHEQIDAIVTALLSIGDEDELPEKWTVVPDQPARLEMNGPAGRLFERYSCLTCHSLNGRGGEMAPDLSAIGSQLDPDWIRDYLKIPFSRRPILSERMPNLFLSDAEIDTLLDFVRLNLVSDSIAAVPVVESTPDLVERGRSLFHETYACAGCHQTNGQGGYVGPPLDGAADRLQPSWIRAWLHDPNRWRPGTIEPRPQADKDEIDALTAYLLTLSERK